MGDKVACAGVGYANHAEIVSVPINLCVKLENEANLKDAAYNTLGAISMQGVRQADMRLGESCVVIGLGLLGQLAALILKASGVTVIGIDVSEAAVKKAVDNNVVDLGLTRNAAGVEEQIQNATNGYGADAVIIAAATPSLDPINFAGAIARKKGKVIVLNFWFIQCKPCVAEFVENDKIKDMLKLIGVNYVQGYAIDKPMLINDILVDFGGMKSSE